MPQRTGSADLPLHGGQVPHWLASRMSRLGAVMAEAIVHHYGRDKLLRRLAGRAFSHTSRRTKKIDGKGWSDKATRRVPR